jgi:hypothetical protein
MRGSGAASDSNEVHMAKVRDPLAPEKSEPIWSRALLWLVPLTLFGWLLFELFDMTR